MPKQKPPTPCKKNLKSCLADGTLRRHSLLRDLDDAEFKELLPGLSCIQLKKGEFAFRSGDAAAYLYIICEGRIKIFLNTSEGREQILYIYNAGDFVGGLNLLKDHEYLYMGQALEDCLITRLDKASFDRCAMHNPLILRRILEKAFDRIRWAEGLITRLAASNAELKVAALLLKLVDDFGVMTREGLRLNLTIKREEMGSYAGLTRETLTRKLVEFQQRGLVKLSGHKTIWIKDLDGLRQLLGQSETDAL